MHVACHNMHVYTMANVGPSIERGKRSFYNIRPVVRMTTSTDRLLISSSSRPWGETNVVRGSERTSFSDTFRDLARGLLCLNIIFPLTKITSYLQNGLQFGVTALRLSFLCTFHSEKFSSTNPSSFMLPWQSYNFSAKFWKLKFPLFFKVFPPERNFLWDNFLCHGHN